MRQENIDYVDFLERKEKFGSAIESLKACYEKLDLIRELYDTYYDNTNSFEEDCFTADIVYLIGAIASDDKYLVEADEHQLDFEQRLNEMFPAEHPIFKYMQRATN